MNKTSTVFKIFLKVPGWPTALETPKGALWLDKEPSGAISADAAVGRFCLSADELCGIQVNALAPGYFATELTQALVDDAAFSEWVRTRTPAGRWGDTQDLVGTLVFLSSRASDFVNGQIVYVDGGMTAVV